MEKTTFKKWGARLQGRAPHRATLPRRVLRRLGPMGAWLAALCVLAAVLTGYAWLAPTAWATPAPQGIRHRAGLPLPLALPQAARTLRTTARARAIRSATAQPSFIRPSSSAPTAISTRSSKADWCAGHDAIAAGARGVGAGRPLRVPGPHVHSRRLPHASPRDRAPRRPRRHHPHRTLSVCAARPAPLHLVVDGQDGHRDAGRDRDRGGPYALGGRSRRRLCARARWHRVRAHPAAAFAADVLGRALCRGVLGTG